MYTELWLNMAKPLQSHALTTVQYRYTVNGHHMVKKKKVGHIFKASRPQSVTFSELRLRLLDTASFIVNDDVFACSIITNTWLNINDKEKVTANSVMSLTKYLLNSNIKEEFDV